MPFTYQRQYKKSPRILTRADGMYYWDDKDNRVLDATAGLWCCNVGHNHPRVTEAIQRQTVTLDYAPTFQMGHPLVFESATKIVNEMLKGSNLGKVFFSNCGSTAVDSALKLALAYQRARGKASKTRFIGREKGYHGVGFGGISVGGIGPNRTTFGVMLPGVDHLPHTHSFEHMAFSKGQPDWGIHLADELERIVELHDSSNIAAVIVEPASGSAGVIVPPKGYLQRLRELCDKHDILLIFDEVITGFGRLGGNFAMDSLGVEPDMITTAKGITNGAVPCGAVFVKNEIHDTMMSHADATGGSIEFFHGYTYSGHPLAMAACIATVDALIKDGIIENGANHISYFEEGIHSLRGIPVIKDIRNLGLMGAVELHSLEGKAGQRAYNAFCQGLQKGVLLRATKDVLAMSPPLIASKEHYDQLFSTLREVLVAL